MIKNIILKLAGEKNKIDSIFKNTQKETMLEKKLEMTWLLKENTKQKFSVFFLGQLVYS